MRAGTCLRRELDVRLRMRACGCWTQRLVYAIGTNMLTMTVTVTVTMTVTVTVMMTVTVKVTATVTVTAMATSGHNDSYIMGPGMLS